MVKQYVYYVTNVLCTDDMIKEVKKSKESAIEIFCSKYKLKCKVKITSCCLVDGELTIVLKCKSKKGI